MKLLLVEDEPKLNQALATGLRARGYTVDSAFDGEEAETAARLNPYDVIVLDVMLPKRDGFEVCRHLRQEHINTPILFLTARDAVEEKVLGLDAGGDDYLVKPFSMEELLARIRAISRRPRESAGDTLTFGDLRLDTRSQTVTADGKLVTLTLREYGLLEYFLRHQGAVVTREDILSHVWDRFFDSFSNVVDVHIKNLRKKLPKTYAEHLQTVWGKGYRFV